MKALLASLAVVALFVSGCPSAYQKTYDEETARLEAQQRLRDQQMAAEAHKYVAIPLFAVGSDELDDTAFREIDWFLEKIAPYPHVAIEVRGYTDSTGSEATNQPLSNKRAWNVQDYMVSRGISADRIDASGYGATDPARPNVTPDGRVQNRRAEIRTR
jgi:chemotaxis protein MotB